MDQLPPPRILVVGATGHLGRQLVTASLASHHPTFALFRPSALTNPASALTNPAKAQLLHSFTAAGAVLVEGSLEDHESLLQATKQVDVLISAVGHTQYLDELKVIAAIKEAGTIKRLLLFDFIGNPRNGLQPHEPVKSLLEVREKVTSALRDSGIPFTYIITYGFASYYLASLGQLDTRTPPEDKVVIAAPGDVKAFMVAEEDIAMYTIKAADDPRTLNKCVHLRLPANCLSQNEMVSLWEAKTGKTLARIYESEEELRKKIEESPNPQFVTAIKHFVFAKGAATKLDIGPDGVEVMDLYPKVNYITADEYLNRFM